MWFITLVVGLVVGYLFRDKIKPWLDWLKQLGKKPE